MNKPHVKSMQTREDFRRSGKQKKQGLWGVSLVLKLVLMAVFIFGAVNMRVHYTQKAENLNREIARAKKELHTLEREIANLKQRREERSSYAYIMKKNAQYNLGLRPADPRQVRRITLIRRKAPAAEQVASAQTAEKRTASIRK